MIITPIKNTYRFLKLETARYINDCRVGVRTVVRQYRTMPSKKSASDVYVCSKNACKNVYKNMHGHHNLLTGPICVAGALLPGGIIWAPVALCLINKLKKVLK